ncbi:MAG: hypothetical protein AAF958_02200 [Planctomycetota bacterium]
MTTLGLRLASVRRRMRLARTVEMACVGLAFGAGISLVLAVTRLLGVWEASVLQIFAPVVACGGLMAIVGVLRPAGAADAARQIDGQYALKDRSITALQFESQESLDSISRLQLEEAETHFEKVDPKQCVELSPRRSHLHWTGTLLAAAASVLIISNMMAPEVVAKTTLPLAVNQASFLRSEMLPELEEVAKETEDPEIEELIKELEEKLEEMESEGLDPADLMAQLSEIEQSLAEAREAMQLQSTDAMMKALAAAIKPSTEMQAASEALEAEDFDKASNEFKKIDPRKLGDRNRRAVADNLKKMMAKLEPGQIGELSNSIGELSEGLEKKNSSQCKKCLSKLAKACKKQGQCKKIGQCMSKQLNRLAQCKSTCRGQCMSNNVAKTNSPSLKAGKGSSGNPLGDKATSLDSSRKEERLTGQMGEGSSETEIMQAPEGQQEAIRQFSKKYADFKRQAEAVLDSEPLPMGHRETVRQYFEEIRPNTFDESVIAEETASE